MFVFSIGTHAVNSIILGWVGSTCGQTQEKKASAYSIVNSFANVSFIWTPVSAYSAPRVSKVINRFAVSLAEE